LKAEFRWTDNPIAKLEALSVNLRRIAIRIAMSKAAVPVRDAYRNAAPSLLGNLKKSVRIRITNYRSQGIWTCTVGPSFRYKRKVRTGGRYAIPGKYASIEDKRHPFRAAAFNSAKGDFINNVFNNLSSAIEKVLR
jgi:HK97 gp10 family phage protein